MRVNPSTTVRWAKWARELSNVGLAVALRFPAARMEGHRPQAAERYEVDDGPLMNRKNVIRTLTAIAVVLLLGWSFFYFSDDTRGYKPVDTSVAMAQIKGGNVKSAQIDDREQQVRLTLKSATDGSDKIITKYPTG